MPCCTCCCIQLNGECCGPDGNKVCCKDPDVCCGTGESQVCCEAPRECCTVYEVGVGESEVCCTEAQYCCNDGQGVCCEVGEICCIGDEGATCCESSVVCCAGVCCAEGECCVDDVCVPCECESDEDCPEGECCNDGVCGGCGGNCRGAIGPFQHYETCTPPTVAGGCQDCDELATTCAQLGGVLSDTSFGSPVQRFCGCTDICLEANGPEDCESASQSYNGGFNYYAPGDEFYTPCDDPP
jgi:hypothetical protein